MTELKIYKKPFYMHHTYVHDIDDRIIFQFDKTVPKEERKLIIDRMNASDKNTVEAPRHLDLKYDCKNAEIHDCGAPYIIIRGWGYLIGMGGLNLGPEKAKEIQDDFAQWIIETLS